MDRYPAWRRLSRCRARAGAWVRMAGRSGVLVPEGPVRGRAGAVAGGGGGVGGGGWWAARAGAAGAWAAWAVAAGAWAAPGAGPWPGGWRAGRRVVPRR